MFKIKRSLTRIQQGIFEFPLFLNFLKHRWLEVLKIKLVIIVTGSMQFFTYNLATSDVVRHLAL